VYPEVLAIAKKIRSGEIHGTKAIARNSLLAVSRVIDDKNFMLKKEETVMSLVKPGSPLAFNLLRAILHAGKVEDVKKIIKFGLKYLGDAKLEVAKHGLELVKEGDNILTASYATNVMELLLEASETKDFKVFVMRSGPNNRGVRTAKELYEAGINVTLIGDTAVNYFMPEVNKVIVGGVAVTKFGLIDQVGVSTMAVCAQFNRIPFYSCIEYLKVSDRLIVDEKPAAELSNEVPVRNPAYDLTRNSLITEYVTDLGRMEPAKFYEKARQRVERLIE